MSLGRKDLEGLGILSTWLFPQIANQLSHHALIWFPFSMSKQNYTQICVLEVKGPGTMESETYILERRKCRIKENSDLLMAVQVEDYQGFHYPLQ